MARKRRLVVVSVVTLGALGASAACRKPVRKDCPPWPAAPAPPARLSHVGHDCAIVQDPPPLPSDPDCATQLNVSMPTRIAVDCPKELRAPNDPPPVARRPPGKESTLRSPPGLSVWLTNCGFVGEMFCGPPPSVECTTPDTRTLHCVQVGPALGNATRFQIAPFFYRDGVGHCHLTPTLTCAIRDQPCPVPETPEVECPVPYPHDDPPDPPHW